MMSQVRSVFYQALRLTGPVMLGYFPMALAFGVLAADPLYASLSGLFVYAGASQFLSVKLLSTHASFYEIALSTFVLNVRHVFYGLQFKSEYSKLPWLQKCYSIFALTDETYAVLAAGLNRNPETTRPLVSWVSALNHLTWIAGCLFGAVLKQTAGLNLKGLDFLLVALFIVLLVENIKRSTQRGQMARDAGIAALVGITLAQNQIPAGLFIGMACMLVYGLWKTSHVGRGPATGAPLNDDPRLP